MILVTIRVQLAAGVSIVLLALAALGCKPRTLPPEQESSSSRVAATDTLKPSAPDDDSSGGMPAADSMGPGNPDTQPRKAATLQDLGGEVTRMIGDAACGDVSQCRMIAYGAKACGGPKQYLVYSVAKTDSTALAALVARYNAMESALNNSEGRMSDCSMVAPPTLARVNGRCVIKP
ncbi:MAG: hypothetical protein ABI613_07085 [Gemmatimonadota bacterium]